MKKLVLSLSVLLLAACGNPFEASVKAERVCVRQLDQTLPGAGSSPSTAFAASAAASSIHKDIPFDLAELPELKEYEELAATLALQSFKLTAPDGVLAGLEKLRIELVPSPESGLPAILLVEYPSTGANALVRIEGNQVIADLTPLGQDLMTYATSNDVQLKIDAEGALPTTEWSAKLEVCAGAEATYDYGSKIGL